MCVFVWVCVRMCVVRLDLVHTVTQFCSVPEARIGLLVFAAGGGEWGLGEWGAIRSPFNCYCAHLLTPACLLLVSPLGDAAGESDRSGGQQQQQQWSCKFFFLFFSLFNL